MKEDLSINLKSCMHLGGFNGGRSTLPKMWRTTAISGGSVVLWQLRQMFHCKPDKAQCSGEGRMCETIAESKPLDEANSM